VLLKIISNKISLKCYLKLLAAILATKRVLNSEIRSNNHVRG